MNCFPLPTADVRWPGSLQGEEGQIHAIGWAACEFQHWNKCGLSVGRAHGEGNARTRALARRRGSNKCVEKIFCFHCPLHSSSKRIHEIGSVEWRHTDGSRSELVMSCVQCLTNRDKVAAARASLIPHTRSWVPLYLLMPPPHCGKICVMNGRFSGASLPWCFAEQHGFCLEVVLAVDELVLVRPKK